MSIEAVKDYLGRCGFAGRVHEFCVSSATVALAAQALGCEEAHIAKTLAFFTPQGPVLIVAAGDAKVDNARFKAQFGVKAKMVPPEEVHALVGHAPGGVCPFCVNSGVQVFLDISLRRFPPVSYTHLLALICSDACSALFLFFVSSIWRYMGGRINTKLWRKMLVYSVPLISASIFWTITNTSDKLFITAMLGAEWNGLFAACYQLPTLLTVVATLFTEAWQLSAFTDGTRAGREEFFGKVFGAYQGLMFLAGAGIIWLCRPIMSIYVAKEFYLGWIFIPVLTFATIFSSFDNFLNSIYMVEKRSGLSLVTMGVGAVMNLILNALLIPIWGVQGAAIATFASYFLVFLVRAYNTRTLIEVDFSPELLALNFGLVVLEAALCVKEVPGSYVWNGIIVLIIAAVNLRGLAETCLRFLRRRTPK